MGTLWLDTRRSVDTDVAVELKPTYEYVGRRCVEN